MDAPIRAYTHSNDSVATNDNSAESLCASCSESFAGQMATTSYGDIDADDGIREGGAWFSVGYFFMCAE